MTQPTYTFAPISPPGVTQDTVTGINNLGEVVGDYPVAGGGSLGFTDANGSYATFGNAGQITITGGINDVGDIVGSREGIASQIPAGFLYDGSTFQTVDVGGSAKLTGINNSDQIVGNYALAGGGPAFLDNGGNIVTVTDPFASNGTFVNGINNAGQLVGYYLDSHSLAHGFLDINGNFSALDDPLGAEGTFATGINDTGQIVGYYVDSVGQQHGFFYSNGNYITVDDPAGTAGSSLTGINNSGQIVGNYLDSNGSHGFVATVAFSAETAGAIVYTAEYGVAPDATELNVLVQFAQPQYAYGQQIGVMDPALYAYQSLGISLASTGTDFQSTFGPSNPTYPASPAGDNQFATDAYASIFGHAGTAAQVQHFVAQLNFFEALYTAAGGFGSPTNIDLLARGAVYGQMLGIEHEIDPTALTTGVSMVGISPAPDMAHAIST